MEWGLHVPLRWGRARVHDTTVPIDAPTSGAFCFDTAHMPSVVGGVVDITGTVGASAITIVDALIAHCYHAQVSDVHIDPTPTHVIVRMRIDGQLSDVYTIPSTLHTQIISRIKVLAGLRIDEHMTPHDDGSAPMLQAKVVSQLLSMCAYQSHRRTMVRMRSCASLSKQTRSAR